MCVVLRSVPRFWKIDKMLKPVRQMPPRNTSKQHEISSIPNILNNGSLQRSKWKTPKGRNTCLHGREENHVFSPYPIYLQTNPLLLSFSYHTDNTQIIYTSSSQSSIWPTFTLYARAIGKANTSVYLVYLSLFNYNQVIFLATIILIFLSFRIRDFPEA